MKYKYLAPFFVSAVILFLTTKISYAEADFMPANGSPPPPPIKEINKLIKLGSGPVREIRKEIKEERCTIITTRINERIDLFNKNKEARNNLYNNVKSKIENIISLLKIRKYDTSKIEADLPGWDTRVNKYWEDKETFMTKLEEARKLSCSDNSDDYLKKVLEAKEMLIKVHNDAEDIRNYYKITLLPDIKSTKAPK